MIKRISVLAVAALLLMLSTENESWAHGFGGFHGGAVHVGGVGGVHVGGVSGARVGGVYARGARVGGIYNRGVVGGNVITGVPAGAIRRGYGYGGYGYGGYGNGNTYILPPAPGKGPAGLDSMGKVNPGGNNLAASNLAKLNQSLSQMRLPSDAGLPAAGSGDK